MVDLKNRFVSWAKQHAIALDPEADLDDFDHLQPLKSVIGDARVVTLGESHHYTREYNRFRSHLFRFLVAEMGFRVFVLEVGLVEAKATHDYVALKHDDTQRAYLNVNQTFGFWAEQQEMLEWMRAYNQQRAPEEHLRFYGMDGSQTWQHCGTAVEAVCDYLDNVNPDYAREVRADLLPLSYSITLTTLGQNSASNLVELNHGMTRLVGHLATEQFEYAERSSMDDFQWALEFAEVARRIAANLTQVHANPEQSLRTWANMRDYYMARQLKWVLDREGPDCRALCGGQNVHLQASTAWEGDISMCTTGQYFKALMPGGATVNIGATANYSLRPDDPSIPESNQGALAEVGLSSFLLDLRPASQSAEVYTWLSEQRPERSNVNYMPVAMAEAYDAIYYTERLTLDELRLPDALKLDPISLAEEDLEHMTGTYVFSSGGWTEEHSGGWIEEVHITREGARLFSNVGEHADEYFPLYKSELFAVSKTEFRWQEWPMELTFDLGEDGIAKGLTVKVGGVDQSVYGQKK